MTTLTIRYVLSSEGGEIADPAPFVPEASTPVEHILEVFYGTSADEIEDDELIEVLLEIADEHLCDSLSPVIAAPVLDPLIKQIRAVLVARDSVQAPAK